jgi:anti-sigma factor RsiW
MKSPTPECRHLLGSISDYLDGELQTDLCREIERHLSGCQDCRVVVDTIRKTISLYHTAGSESEVPAGVRERLYKRLDLEDLLKTSRGS